MSIVKLLHVRRSKNDTSHRVIPLNASAIEAVARMLERADLLGHTEPVHDLWPACQWGRYDPTKPMLKWDTAWRALRDAAGLHGLRFHALRHTVITELAEIGVADYVLESTAAICRDGCWSTIRTPHRREASGARCPGQSAARRRRKWRRKAGGREIEAVVADDLTSQSRHGLLLSGSPAVR